LRAAAIHGIVRSHMPETATDLDIAHAYARAYREADGDALRTMIAPDLRARVLVPSGFHEITGMDTLIAAQGGFFEHWRVLEVVESEVCLLEHDGLRPGRLARVAQRFRLRADDGREALMDVTNLITIRDGQIGSIDELCSGPMLVGG
jgi:hypothetical protein